MQKLNGNLTEEANECLTQITIEGENELKTRMNWQKERFFQKQLTSESFDNDNKLTLKNFFAFCSVLFTRTNGGKTETTPRQKVSGFQNTPALHQKAKTYSALSFHRINFFNMANLFLFSRKAFVMCYCSRAPIKTFFFDACQMTVKSCVLHLFPVA